MKSLLFYIAAIFLVISAEAREYKGEVVAVSDGDTITMRAGNNRKMKIRLAEIDAPEKKQPYGAEAKASLTSLLNGQNIIVEEITRDRYKRMVGIVYRVDDGLNANKEITQQGGAWAYRYYLHDQSFLELENAARANKIGLWNLPESERQPPWEWRKQQLDKIKIK